MASSASQSNNMGKKRNNGRSFLKNESTQIPAGSTGPPRQPNGNMSIGDILRSSNLTDAEIQRIEHELRFRDGEIDKCNIHINKTARDYGNMGDALQKSKDDLRQSTKELRDSEAALTDMTERKEGYDGLLKLSRELIERKDGEIEHRDGEIEGLRVQLEARDTECEELHEQVVRMGMASQTEAMAIMGEVSAQKSLKVIQGLQRDIVEREERISALGTANRHRDEEIQFLKQRIEQLEEREREKGMEVEGAKREAADATKREVEGRETENELRRKLGEVEEIANEQQSLIERLLKK